jgi:Protein of unknown function (DUF3048) N-terminal domain/Protein of unknown function (DUF3048) C-terminal domain
MLLEGRARGFAALAAVAAAALVVEGYLLFAPGQAARTPVHVPPSPSPSPSPAPTRHVQPLRSPFTGKPVKSLRRVLAVKIGNTVPERPATGLSRADIVYVIPVEGGLSRILAIFSSHYPRVVGPVRSARQDDIRLLRQFGRPAFVYSGAQPRLLPVVEHSRIVDLYAGRSKIAGDFYRSLDRPEPYNFYARTRPLLKAARTASVARDIGFRFGPAPPGGHPREWAWVSYPSASFRFTWSAAYRRWAIWMDGSPAYTTERALQLSAPTVVIQRIAVGLSPYLEQGPIEPPYATTVGSGTALVLRGGEAFHAHWSRPVAGGGTTFTTDTGQPMTFARGPVWIVYAYGPGSSRWRGGKPVPVGTPGGP